MSKLSLSKIVHLEQSLSKLNDNFARIEHAINEQVLFRSNPVGEANTMHNNMDMAGHELINVSTDKSPTSLTSRGYVDTAVSQVKKWIKSYTYSRDDFATQVDGKVKEVCYTKAQADAKYALKSNTYTKAEIDIKLDNLPSGGGSVDLSDYYTKAETDALIPDVSGKADKSSVYTKAETDALIPDLTPYATKAYVDAKPNVAINGVENAEDHGVLPSNDSLTNSDNLDALIAYCRANGKGIQFGVGTFMLARKHTVDIGYFRGVNATTSGGGAGETPTRFYWGGTGGFRFTGNFCNVGGFNVTSGKANDDDIGIDLYKFRYSKIDNVLALGWKTGLFISTFDKDLDADSQGSWSTITSNIQIWGCLRAVATDMYEVNAVRFENLKIVGTPQSWGTNVWGHDTNTTYGFFFDSAEITDPTMTLVTMGVLDFNGTIFERCSGAAIYIKCTKRTAAGTDLTGVYLRQINVSNVYSEKNGKTIQIDLGDVGFLQDSKFERISYTNSTSWPTASAVEIYGSNISGGFGAMRNVTIDSATIGSTRSRGDNWASHKKVMLEGLGPIPNNVNNRVGVEHRVDLIVNKGDPIGVNLPTWASYYKIRMAQPIILPAFHSVRIKEIGFTFTEDLSTLDGTDVAGGIAPVRFFNQGSPKQMITRRRDAIGSYNIVDETPALVSSIIANGVGGYNHLTDGTTYLSDGRYTTGTKMNSFCTFRDWDGFQDIDRVLNWPEADIRLRIGNSSQWGGNIPDGVRVTGYILLETWEQA